MLASTETLRMSSALSTFCFVLKLESLVVVEPCLAFLQSHGYLQFQSVSVNYCWLER